MFIGFGISRILVVTCVTFNSEIPAQAVLSSSLTLAIKYKTLVYYVALTHRVIPESHIFFSSEIKVQTASVPLFVC